MCGFFLLPNAVWTNGNPNAIWPKHSTRVLKPFSSARCLPWNSTDVNVCQLEPFMSVDFQAGPDYISRCPRQHPFTSLNVQGIEICFWSDWEFGAFWCFTNFRDFWYYEVLTASETKQRQFLRSDGRYAGSGAHNVEIRVCHFIIRIFRFLE